MRIAFLFYEGMTALDVIGPHEILCRLPKAEIYRCASRPGIIQSDSQLKLIADHALSEVSSADVLLVPGAGNATALREHPETLKWLFSIHKTTTWTTSVCTGSLILGAAGILSGLRATSHWAAIDRLADWDAIATEARIVEDEKVITAAGVSAGIDMALHLVAKIAGNSFAQAIQLGIEYDPAPPFDAGSPQKANPAILNALRARLTNAFEKK